MGGTRAQRRQWRAEVVRPLAEEQHGVVSRAQLRSLGIGWDDVAVEERAGRWAPRGRRVVLIHRVELDRRGRLFAGVLEAGPGAVLDGAAALIAAGLTGFDPPVIDVSIPSGRRPCRLPGVRIHQHREVGDAIRVGLPRVKPELAALRAAGWAVSDRQAALLLVLPVQQRLLSAARLRSRLELVQRNPRRELITAVVRDCADGAESLGELDFARMCRARGLPPPSRQVLRTGPNGRVYLDTAWEDIGLAVEIDGAGHAWGLNGVEDQLRQNEVTLGDEVVLRISVIGLLVEPRFMDQIVRAHRVLSTRAGR